MLSNVAAKKIIITGASSGIGERIAWHVAKNGGVPIMLARSVDKLLTIQQQMERVLGRKSCAYPVDLLNEHQQQKTMEQILVEHKSIDALINNAGIGYFDYVDNMDWAEIEQMFQLNVFSLIRLTKWILPHFAEKNEGHIINIASQAGKIATPKSAVYGATKHAVLGFTNALRLEVANKNIQVMAVNLGPVRTNFFSLADPDGSYQKNVSRYMLDPDEVAKKIVQSLFTNKREINMPWWMEFGSKIYHLFPALLERALKGQFNKK